MVPTLTLVAQTCLDVLLRLDKNVITRDSLWEFSLAEYAAECWLNHVQFGNLLKNVDDRMKRLFGPGKSLLVACLWIHDLESPRWMRIERAERPSPLTGTPLRYAALLGLHTIVKFLGLSTRRTCELGFHQLGDSFTSSSEKGTRRGRSLPSRVCRECVQPRTWIWAWRRQIHVATREGQLRVARFLNDYGTDVNACDMYSLTPLHVVSQEGTKLEVARFYISHSADVNAQDMYRFMPIH